MTEPISPKDAVRAFIEAMSPDGYVGMFVNRYGERWVFTCTPKGEAKVTGQDVNWAVYPVTAPPAVRTPRPGLRVTTVGDLILGEDEAAWLTACWNATRPMVEHYKKGGAYPIATREESDDDERCD
jgi:hypothetical protein